MPSIIEFDRVTVRFVSGPQHNGGALREVSFRLEERETKILLGASGSGKSVLLKTALGLVQPDSGRVLLFGQDLSGLAEEALFPLRRRAGMVFQESALFDSLTVAENVGYYFEQEEEIPVPEEEVEERVRQALRFVELEETLEKFPSELSGGMRRRVAIARALIGAPPLMLYDSPTAGLDPVTAFNIMVLILKLRDTQRVSALLVTHRLQDAHLLAESYFDPQAGELARVGGNGSAKLDTHTSFLVLREGELVFQGSESELFAARDPYVRKFIS